MGALRPAGRPVGVPRPRRGRTGAARRDDRAVVGRRPSGTRCCRSTTGRSPSWCSGAPPSVRARARYTYWPGRAPVPESVAVNVRSRAHDITAHVTVPDGSTCSRACSRCRARCSAAGRSTSSPTAASCYVHNLAGWREYRVEADVGRLAPGDHTLAFRFRPPAAELLVDGEVVGSRRGEAHGVEPVLAHRRRPHRRLVTRLRPADGDYRGRFEFTGVAAPRRHRRGGAARWSTPRTRPRRSSPRSDLQRPAAEDRLAGERCAGLGRLGSRGRSTAAACARRSTTSGSPKTSCGVRSRLIVLATSTDSSGSPDAAMRRSVCRSRRGAAAPSRSGFGAARSPVAWRRGGQVGHERDVVPGLDPCGAGRLVGAGGGVAIVGVRGEGVGDEHRLEHGERRAAAVERVRARVGVADGEEAVGERCTVGVDEPADAVDQPAHRLHAVIGSPPRVTTGSISRNSGSTAS